MQIQLPDGSIKELPEGSSAYDVAASIGEGLAKAAIGAKVDGELYDLHRPLPGDCSLAIVTAPRLNKKGIPNYRDEQSKADALYLLRHSAAHVMAEAIERLYPDVQLAYGPPLDNGFYYDMKLDTPISSDDFEKIEAEMRKIVEEDRSFRRYDLTTDLGKGKLGQEGNKYKEDNANRALQTGARTLSFYITGDEKRWKGKVSGKAYVSVPGIKERWLEADSLQNRVIESSDLIEVNENLESDGHDHRYKPWEDLCQGPHVDRTSRIAAYKVMSVASSNWHGDVNSDRFQRVYGTAFFSQEELDQHLNNLEEATRRDHRVVGQKLGLYTIDNEAGQGLVLWKPKGAVIRDELTKFIIKHLERQGYSQVFTPHIGKLDLYRTSGHFPYYQDSQFPPLVDNDMMKSLVEDGSSVADLSGKMKEGDIEGYMLKPMNCPHHVRIYASDKHSYRDLPIRIFEFGTVYRWEQSGELGGMTRVRGFTQDDAHLFVTPDQLADEVMGCIELVKIIFSTLGMEDFRVRVGLRDPDSSKFVGDEKDWDAAEDACRAAAKALGVPFVEEAGEAAFYGPKIDFVVKDVIGREWQLGTVQIDYQLPQRFNLEYVGADNKTHQPIMIHRAPFGSLERFVGLLIEHFNGAFPLWLSPEQCRILPVSEKFLGYAEQVEARLKQERFRVSVDRGNDRLGGKIKSAQEDKLPYMLVVGGKDAEAGTVSVRHCDQGDLGAVGLEDFIENILRERDTQGLGPMGPPMA
ncbi:MAG: threonine--tRNA ligase [Planctomycetota bacterium]